MPEKCRKIARQKKDLVEFGKECLMSRPVIPVVSCYVLMCHEILPIMPYGQTELAQGTPREELSPQRLPDWRAKEHH